jgi:hypothetical protein
MEWETESGVRTPGVLARYRSLRAAIGLREIRIGHYWLRPANSREP